MEIRLGQLTERKKNHFFLTVSRDGKVDGAGERFACARRVDPDQDGQLSGDFMYVYIWCICGD